MLVNRQCTTKVSSRSTAGFTLLEVIIVVATMGILGAIGVPAWFGFMERISLNIAQDQIYRAMQQAKSKAKLEKLTWQVSVRENDQVVQWAVHPAKSGEFIPPGVQWNDMALNIRIDKEKNNKGDYETTLDSPGRKTVSGPWRVQFNDRGNTNGQLGRVTLRSDRTGNVKRCVIVSTLIGTLRTGNEHRQSKDGKYCY